MSKKKIIRFPGSYKGEALPTNPFTGLPAEPLPEDDPEPVYTGEVISKEEDRRRSAKAAAKLLARLKAPDPIL